MNPLTFEQTSLQHVLCASMSMSAPLTLGLSLLLLSFGCVGKLITNHNQLSKNGYDFVIVGGVLPDSLREYWQFTVFLVTRTTPVSWNGWKRGCCTPYRESKVFSPRHRGRGKVRYLASSTQP